ncbi:hypothetical protein LUZ60_003583 [Juncus effusus]|nr:hypothetical protein LUZ60_003583 [Juncus effusus]
MALVPFINSSLVELDAGSEFVSLDSLAAMVESQRQLFHSQIDQLERIVVKQCQLTGVNPLSQEMAAGAFSINIGKRPKDLLNPKAVKHMQSVFSLKDNIGKREAREISALCGITVRQVNEYFTSQRSRVRKFVRLSREKASRLEPSSKLPLEALSTNPESVSASIHVQQQQQQDVMCVNPDIVSASGSAQQNEALCVNPSTAGIASRTVRNETSCVNLSTVGIASRTVQDEPLFVSSEATPASITVRGDALSVDSNPESFGASRSVQKEVIGASRTVQKDGAGASPAEAVGASRSVQKEGDVGASSSVRKEGEEGGLKEEDKKIVEDLVGLMNKEMSFSGQVRLMESLLRIDDEAALSWFLAKEGLSILLTWLGEAATEEQTSVILVIFKVLCHLPLNKALTTQISAILQAINRLRFYKTSDISNRAKVLLAKWSKLLRSQLVKKNPNDSQKDLIRKQRIRELLHGQSWNSEVGFPDDILALTENGDEKLPENKKTLRLLNAPYEDLTKKNGSSPSVLKNKVKRKVLLVDQPNRSNSAATTRVARINHPTNSRPLSTDDIQKAKLRASWQKQKHGGITKPDLNPKPEEKMKEIIKKPVPVVRSVEQPDIDPSNLMERLSRAKIRWRAPPEIKLDPAWQVSAGQNSKESLIQTHRTRRGSEALYPDPLSVPPNPKDPWDRELDFDDSLTPLIPLNQDPDPDPVGSDPNPVEPDQVGAGPDMELLAVLLRNPEVVFALTEGRGGGMSGERMVELMDRLKSSGLSLADLANGLESSKGSGSGSEGLGGSFPSPTPAPLERANWKSDYHAATQPTVLSSPVVAPSVVSTTNHYNSVVSAFNVQQNQSNVLSLPQMTVSMNPPAQHFTSVNSMQNPYLGQNVSNHQNMQNFVQPWDSNAGYLHSQNGYSNSNNNSAHLMPGPTWDQNQNMNQNPDAWGQGRIGESSAVWGYNGQRRNYNNGQNWRR